MFNPVKASKNIKGDFVNYIAEDLKENKLLNNNTQAGYEKMYVSANPEQFKIAAKMFYEVKELPELV